MIIMGRWSASSEILCPVVVYFVVFLIVGDHIDEAWAATDLALLSGTLRTKQAHACDSNELRIECPPETVISINYAYYGKASQEQICDQEDDHHGDQLNGWNNGNHRCNSSNALEVIEKKCREQRICRLMMSPETFGEDPCPGDQKYAEVAYKCRPVEFRNRVICEGERLLLRCRKIEQKILIFSATFGSTQYETVECPQKKEGKSEDCQSSYATEIVITSCHRQKKCSLAADVQTFGNPGCSPSTRKHLKVIFTCVPDEVLISLPTVSNEYDGGSQEDPVKVYTTSYPGWAGNRDYTVPAHFAPENTKRSAANVNSTKSEMQSDEISGDSPSGENCTKNQRVVGFITEWISAYKFMSDNKEKLILYVVASVGIGLLLFFLMLAGRLYHLRARARRRAKFSHSPHNEGEFLDDDSDLEPTERDERPPSRHSSRISVRRQDSDVQTRTPLTQGDTHNHYYS